MRIESVLALAVIAACSGGGSGQPDGGGSDAADSGMGAAETFPQDFARVECETAERCGSYETVEKCLATTQLELVYAQAVAGVAANVTRFDADAAAACLASRRDDTCRSQNRLHDDPCLRVYVGLVADNAPCQFNEACASRHCEPADTSCDQACCPGTCRPWNVPRDVAIGGACSNDDHCVQDAYCHDDTQQCTAAITTEGAACVEVFDCAAPMVCDTNAQQPTCRRPAEPNAPCMAGVVQPCIDQRDRCLAGTCQRALEPSATCSGFFDCVYYASCVNTTCIARPAAGDTCGPSTPMCMGFATCQSGTCTVMAAAPICTTP